MGKLEFEDIQCTCGASKPVPVVNYGPVLTKCDCCGNLMSYGHVAFFSPDYKREGSNA